MPFEMGFAGTPEQWWGKGDSNRNRVSEGDSNRDHV